MARITKAVAVLNDIVGPILDPSEEAKYATLFVGAGAGTLVMEVSGQDNGANPPVDEWAPVTMTVANVDAATIVAGGAAQFGYALIPGGHKVRGRVSVAGAGARVTLALSEV